MTEYHNLSDEELVALAKNGNLNCETELLYRHKSTVAALTRNYFLISGDNEDLVQEGMIALFKAIYNYNPEKNASFKTFAITCIKRRIIDIIRHTRHDVTVCDECGDDIFDLGEPDWLTRARAELSDAENKILDDYLSGLSYAEIADNLLITAKNVDNKLQKIKKIIKKIIENNGL